MTSAANENRASSSLHILLMLSGMQQADVVNYILRNVIEVFIASSSLFKVNPYVLSVICQTPGFYFDIEQTYGT